MTRIKFRRFNSLLALSLLGVCAPPDLPVIVARSTLTTVGTIDARTAQNARIKSRIIPANVPQDSQVSKKPLNLLKFDLNFVYIFSICRQILFVQD